MTTLRDLLASHVRPRPDDDLLTMIHRAEDGIRLTSALTISAAASILPPGPAALILHTLPRAQAGTLGHATSIALRFLEGTNHPLAPWYKLTRQARGGEGRTIDWWLSDYEGSLRHTGRRPPPIRLEDLRERFQVEIHELCDRMLELVTMELTLDGAGGQTSLMGENYAEAVAPFVELHDGELWLWNGTGRHNGEEVCRSICVIPATRGEIEGQRLDSMVREATARPWKHAGAARRLAESASGEPLEAYLGEGDGEAWAWAESVRIAYTTSQVDPVQDAEAMAMRWRGTRRPVVVLPAREPAEARELLETLLAPERSLSLILSSWRGTGRDAPVIMLAASRLAAETVDAVDELLWADVSSDHDHKAAPEKRTRLGRLVVVTTEQHFRRTWSARFKERFEEVMSLRAPDLPLAVSARTQAGLPLEEAWLNGFLDVFDVDVERPETLLRVLDVVTGRQTLIECSEAFGWWLGGHLKIDPDGSAALTHGGWGALLEGLGGTRSMSGHNEAFAAGVALRKFLHSSEEGE